MKINKLIASALVSAAFALEAWTLKEIITVKVQVAVLTTRVESFNVKNIAAAK